VLPSPSIIARVASCATRRLTSDSDAPGALADQLDLGLALPRQHLLDLVCQHGHATARDLAQRRALVPEDAGIAVLVGAERPADPDVREHSAENLHRMLEPRVLGVRLDPRERRLGAGPLDLELGNEHDRLAAGALRIDHRPLVGEEDEAGEVADVVLAEEDVAAEAVARDVLEQPPAPLLELGRRDTRHGAHAIRGYRARNRSYPSA
jgi:hypothetical protein